MFAVLGSHTSLSFPHTERSGFILGQLVRRQCMYFTWLLLYAAESTPLSVRIPLLWASVS